MTATTQIVVLALSVMMLLVIAQQQEERRTPLLTPQNPCAGNIFEYKQNRRYNYGQITIPYDHSFKFDVLVNVSLVGLHENQKLNLELLTPRETILTTDTLTFALHFPVQDVLPRITNIQYNDQVFCSGQPETWNQLGITNLWVKYSNEIVLVNQTAPVQGGQSQTTTAPPRTTTKRRRKTTTTTTTRTTTTSGTTTTLPTTTRRGNEFVSQVRPSPEPAIPGLFTSPPFLSRPTEISLGELQTSKPLTQPQQQQPQQEPQCGLSNEDAPDHEHPWLIAIFYFEKSTYQFRSTAILITQLHAITAGHCLQYHKALLLPKEKYILNVGRGNHNSGFHSLRTIVNIWTHPDYKQTSSHGDISILKFNEEVAIKKNIRPICFPWTSQSGDLGEIVGKKGTVSGWVKSNATVIEARKVGGVPVASKSACVKSNKKFEALMSDATFCAGKRDGVSGPCGRDGGSAMITEDKGRWYLRGIVSKGVSDNVNVCNLNEYVVFVDVVKVKDWILETIKN